MQTARPARSPRPPLGTQTAPATAVHHRRPPSPAPAAAGCCTWPTTHPGPTSSPTPLTRLRAPHRRTRLTQLPPSRRPAPPRPVEPAPTERPRPNCHTPTPESHPSGPATPRTCSPTAGRKIRASGRRPRGRADGCRWSPRGRPARGLPGQSAGRANHICSPSEMWPVAVRPTRRATRSEPTWPGTMYASIRRIPARPQQPDQLGRRRRGVAAALPGQPDHPGDHRAGALVHGRLDIADRGAVDPDDPVEPLLASVDGAAEDLASVLLGQLAQRGRATADVRVQLGRAEHLHHLRRVGHPQRLQLDHPAASRSSASTIVYAYPCSARNRCRCAAYSWSRVSRATTV